MGYITSQTVPSGIKYFVLPVPDDLYMRLAVRGTLESLCDAYSWEMAGAEGLTEEQQAGLFCAAFAGLQELETLPTGGGMIGTISWYATQGLPSGVLLCNGQIYEASAYPELYAVIADSLKLPGDRFKVPNLIGKYATGTSEDFAIGESVGSDSMLLLPEHVPDHKHKAIETGLEVILWAQGGTPRAYSGGTNRNSVTVTQTGGVAYDKGSTNIPVQIKPLSTQLLPGIVANEQT